MFYIRWIKVWLSVFGGLLFQHSYSKEWDKCLLKLIEDEEPVKFSAHTVQIGRFNVWTSNRWYAYANCYNPLFSGKNSTPERRPSIATLIKFSDYIEKQAFK